MEFLVTTIQNFQIEEVVGNVWYITMGMIGFDILTGLLAAGKERKLNSSINYTGMIRKVGLLLLVAIGVFLDAVFSMNGYITKLCVGMITVYEGLSIVENFNRIGIDAKFLTQFFDENKLKQKGEKKDV